MGETGVLMGVDYAAVSGGPPPVPGSYGSAPASRLLLTRRREGGEDAKWDDDNDDDSNNNDNNNSNSNSNGDVEEMGEEQRHGGMSDPEATATAVVDAAFRIHVRLGPGLLESVYEALLAYELRRGGHSVLCQRTFGFYYDDVLVKRGLKADLIVDDCVVVEVKAAESTARVHKRQLFTYLRALDLRLGLVVNFGGATMKEGLFRVVNHHDEAGSPLRIAQPPPRRPRKWTRLRSWIRHRSN
ncbi:MAG TPA: GxxExxY protein [Longimicrobiales bacterium]|nr:GxxExxY protein [Longimicrobiales bacterium]